MVKTMEAHKLIESVNESHQKSVDEGVLKNSYN